MNATSVVTAAPTAPPAAASVEPAVELSGSGAGRRLRTAASRAARDLVGLGAHTRTFTDTLRGAA